MSYRIRCYSLFNIKNTGVTSRKLPDNMSDDEIVKWRKARNSQLNFDTVLQVISIRGQPENLTDVTSEKINFEIFNKFGFLFEHEEDQECYRFDFSVNYSDVFDDGIHELGALLSDCNGVPIVKVGDEFDKLPSFLDSSPELRNIFFEVIDERE